MYLVITRTFPPELGGMQNLMWGLARSLAKINLIKVFADYHENHEEFDNTVSFSIERVSGMKLIRKYRKSYLINDYIENNKNVKCLIADHWKSLELIKTNKKHEKVDREISTGAEIQSQLLPDYCPIIHGIDLAAHCRPALQLGGDYYDFMCLKTNISEKRKAKSRWAFVIGDVMGKGIPAGLLMTMLRGMLRAEVLTGLPPDRILHDLNQLAINDLDQSHRFVTLFYSDYDPRTRKLRFANAAHNPPLLWKSADQKIVKLDAKGFVLGLQKDAEYHCGEIKLNQNDLVLYYTDGVIDTSNSLGQRFDEERLIKTLTKLCKQSYTSQEILNKIFKKLDDFTGQNRHMEDDATMVIFQLK